jgi:hypothetical protein
MSPWLRQQLELRTRATGRSMASELELLVEQRLREERPIPAAWEAAYARQTSALLWILGEIMRAAGEGWLTDPQAYDETEAEIRQILGLLDPLGRSGRKARPGTPAYKLLWRYFGPNPRPADALQAQWLNGYLGEAAKRLIPQEGARHD